MVIFEPEAVAGSDVCDHQYTTMRGQTKRLKDDELDVRSTL